MSSPDPDGQLSTDPAAARAPRPARLVLDGMASPIGAILLVTDGDGTLRALDFEDHEARMTTLLARHYGAMRPERGAAPESLRSAIAAYFDGELDALSSIAWATGGTAFQRRYCQALTDIQAGRTTTYGALAERLGMPNAARAIGHANGANPVSIVVPCHRVIGADGTLTGYGGGIERKRWLLRHEGALDRS